MSEDQSGCLVIVAILLLLTTCSIKEGVDRINRQLEKIPAQTVDTIDQSRQ